MTREPVRDMVNAYFDNLKSNNVFIIVNGIKFYYDPKDIDINSQEIINQLINFKGEDLSYSVYEDENVGLVIF